ncbi:MAG: metallopeptidase family protein [Nocardioides sp.]
MVDSGSQTPNPATYGAAPPAPAPHRRDLRDRHGRGLRGPLIGSSSRSRSRSPSSRGARFDALVIETVSAIEGSLRPSLRDRLGLVEYAVEDTPLLPADWTGDQVPLAALVRAGRQSAAKVVLFRRPIEHRCDSPADLEALVHVVLVEQVAELLGVTPRDIDHRFED